MLEIVEMLQELAKKIGNNASVGIEFHQHDNIPPEIIFRVDWPNDFHFRHSIPFLRMECQPDDILKIITYHAQRAYDREKTS